MDSTSLCFTHVNPQHLHGNSNISENSLPMVIDYSSQSFWDQAALDVYPFAQSHLHPGITVVGHPSLLNTPFVFRAAAYIRTVLTSECLKGVDDSLFLSPSMPANDLLILGNELAQSTSTSVEEPISSVLELEFFTPPYCSSGNDDIFGQFEINDVPDLFIDIHEVSSNPQDPVIANVHLIEGTSTRNKKKDSQQDLPPQKKTKSAPKVTVVKSTKKYSRKQSESSSNAHMKDVVAQKRTLLSKLSSH
ncbi:uncharacterized protein MELLADRAFT_59207 [Melampsora larici-populina 98AG31]|uniref:Uncharacterized protein n=1 Tax=Melampsora larici-populina (strain 98AG31 / pathotype 3-4-7) TaxID=747676 RepID=F4R5F8_MELLP|nr:uncharacterized protein MELLADRAFT_59207 [Melampsora larici-populina 98AG31]EGG12040.1 hypothetical protein MELLADRAFT_59207 [Melampsora larici-populina 98AG31]